MNNKEKIKDEMNEFNGIEDVNYDLLKSRKKEEGGYLVSALRSGREFFCYIAGDTNKLIVAFIFIVINSVAGVITPYYIARAIDTYITSHDLGGLMHIIYILVGLFGATIIAGYVQGVMMGGVSQRTLFRLRNALFERIQLLPIAFFTHNKAGDLMSRLNNDTDKLSQFLSQSVVRFIGSFFVIFGIGVFIFFLNIKLALVLLSSTILIFVMTRIFSPFVEKQNSQSLRTLGLFSSTVQESLSNFKVVIAFNRRNYFKQSLDQVNEQNYKASLRSSFANHIFEPIYDFAGNTAQLVVLIFGIYFIVHGQLTIGLLIGFLGYAQKFYDPLRIMATIFGDIQVSLASWSRVRDILNLESNVCPIPELTQKKQPTNPPVIQFKNVSFGYEAGQHVLQNINITLEQGKTYAIVGPTGGGKTTTANLMSRLYDPTDGSIFLKGQDIRAYTSKERGAIVGVILQEPFLFTGTVGDNIKYGNESLSDTSFEDLEKILKKKGLEHLLDRFQDRLNTEVNDTAENISLGQKQLISFIRILLREPKLLILDEATANIDTVTEEILSGIIEKLPSTTTKVVIAHRLNTIRQADEIIFINAGSAERALDFEHALELINSTKRDS